MYTEDARNILDITDAEVAQDWVLGLAQSMGMTLLDEGKVGSAHSMWGQNPQTIHLRECGAESIVCLSHDFEEEAIFDTFDSGRTTTNEVIRGKVTCKCGEISNAVISYSASAGDLMYAVLRNK